MITFWRSNSSSDPGGRSNALKVAPHLDKVEAAASRFSCVARSASDQRGVRHKPMRGFPEAETAAGRPDVACKPSEVFDRSGEKPDRVERLGDELEAGAVDGAEARLDRRDAAVGRGADHRTAGLRTERKRHHEVGDGGRRAAGGPARRMRGVVRIARRRWMVGRELGGLSLAQNHRARGFQRHHARGIGFRAMAAVDRGVVFGRQLRGVDHVLDADRDAVQEAAARRAVERSRLRECVFLVQERPGTHGFLARADALEARGDERLGGELAALDAARGLSRREPGIRVGSSVHRSGSAGSVARSTPFSQPKCGRAI